MAETADLAVDAVPALLAQADLREWLVAQRWYASRSRSVTSVESFDAVKLGEPGDAAARDRAGAFRRPAPVGFSTSAAGSASRRTRR